MEKIKIKFQTSNLSKKEWQRLASFIDNDFFNDFENFTFDRKIGYNKLNTNRCDSCSFVKVYSTNVGISKIEVLSQGNEEWDGDWREILPSTYNKISEYLLNLQK